MRNSRLIIIVILIALLTWMGYSLIRQKWDVEKEIANISEAAKKLDTENKSIKTGISYFEHPENIEKELKKQFNYKVPGEQMIIVVPDQATTTTSTKK